MKQFNSVEIEFRGDKPWQTLFNLYRAERFPLCIALVSYLFKASPVWILPVITANIIDIIGQHPADGEKKLLINGVIGVVAILQNIPAAAIYISYVSRSIRNMEVRLRSAIVRRLQLLSINYHNQTDTSILQTKVTRDIESVEQLSRQLIDIGFVAIVTILITWTVTAFRMPIFLPVFIIFVPLILIILRIFASRLRRHNENLRKELEAMNSMVSGMITMIPVTRAHGVEIEEIDRAESKFSRVKDVARSFDFIAGTFGATTWVILMIFNFVGLVIAAWLNYRGALNLTPGDIVLFAGYFNTIMAAVIQLNSLLPVITRGFDGLRSIGEVLESPDIEVNQGKPAIQKVIGGFNFENVSFSYENNKNFSDLLKNINLKVSPGEIIGIVGPSGSGKSTLISLLIGFHRPTRGKILLDGVDMNTLDLRTYRRHLSVVSQKTILFSGTIRENIIYGMDGVRESDLEAAVESADAGKFINELPDGINTKIGQEGVQLSGGQQQRIAIARAILRDPKVLILDEATSALDTKSEMEIEQALGHLMIGRTTFIIAHRQAVLKRATRLIRLEHGELSEEVAV